MSKSKLKIGLELFWIFLKIGCFTFGSGWSVLAQLEQEFVDKRKAITKADLLELTTVGKSVPGIMITNICMLFGYQMGGWFGGVCAVVGLTVPAVFILTAVTFFYDAVKGNPWFGYAMRGIGGAVVAIISGAAVSLGKEALRRWSAVLICAAAFLLGLLTDISNIALILIGVVGALCWYGVRLGLEKKKGGDGK